MILWQFHDTLAIHARSSRLPRLRLQNTLHEHASCIQGITVDISRDAIRDFAPLQRAPAGAGLMPRFQPS